MTTAVDDTGNQLRSLLMAVSFAARAHQCQFRRDGCTPYVSHPFRVCLVLREVFKIDDPKILTAAVLHDTIEDTTTDFDDLAKWFGADVAGWVAALSKDKRQAEPERESAYVEQLRSAPWQVQLCKLADVYDNLLDSGDGGPGQAAQTLRSARRYLDALRSEVSEAAPAWRKVSALLERLSTAPISKPSTP